MTIGEKIKTLRIQKNLTQKELAEKTGFSEITIRKYESDERNPKFSTIEKIGSVLNVSGAWLLGYDVPMDSKVTADEAWDAEADKFNDKMSQFQVKEKAFLHQLKVLGWICEHEDNRQDAEEDDSFYVLKKAGTSFRISWEDYNSFIEDSEKFFNTKLEMLYEKSKIVLFPKKDIFHLEPQAAHERTDIEVTDEMIRNDDDIMDNDDFWK